MSGHGRREIKNIAIETFFFVYKAMLLSCRRVVRLYAHRGVSFFSAYFRLGKFWFNIPVPKAVKIVFWNGARYRHPTFCKKAFNYP